MIRGDRGRQWRQKHAIYRLMRQSELYGGLHELSGVSA